MPNFSMTCTCGHTMTTEAASRDEAVEQFRSMMTQEALDQHMRERHPAGEQAPTLEQAHAIIGQTVQAAA